MYGYHDLYEDEDELHEQISKENHATTSKEVRLRYCSVYRDGITQCEWQDNCSLQKSCKGFISHSFYEDRCIFLLDGKHCMNINAQDFLKP